MAALADLLKLQHVLGMEIFVIRGCKLLPALTQSIEGRAQHWALRLRTEDILAAACKEQLQPGTLSVLRNLVIDGDFHEDAYAESLEHTRAAAPFVEGLCMWFDSGVAAYDMPKLLQPLKHVAHLHTLRLAVQGNAPSTPADVLAAAASYLAQQSAKTGTMPFFFRLYRICLMGPKIYDWPEELQLHVGRASAN